MKKGQKVIGKVLKMQFPNKGIVQVIEEDQTDIGEVAVKNALPNQEVSFFIKKLHRGKGRAEGNLCEVTKKAPYARTSPCPHFGMCGGCLFQEYPYEKQLQIKEGEVLELLQPVFSGKITNNPDNPKLNDLFEGIKPSPVEFGYRNKMEYTFGDEVKGGPLTLGMHKRGGFYDIVSVDECKIADEDFGVLIKASEEYFKALEVPYLHRLLHTGYLRHLCVRKAAKTGEILINLVTTTQQEVDLSGYTRMLLALKLKGSIVGVLHTNNDSLADVVQKDSMETLYGQDYFFEELLGMKFKITPFSFFQTNSYGAEVLYDTVRSYVGDLTGKSDVVFDLYSGTGTIAQLMAPVAKEVVGVEIVEEAVAAATENAELNGLSNCTFLAGDVLKVLDEIEKKPDLIILDPPRDGIHPKALDKIIGYGVDRIVYVSCKPTSLARDLEVFLANGYEVKRVCCVDMFPATANVETVCLFSKIKK